MNKFIISLILFFPYNLFAAVNTTLNDVQSIISKNKEPKLIKISELNNEVIVEFGVEDSLLQYIVRYRKTALTVAEKMCDSTKFINTSSKANGSSVITCWSKSKK